MKKNILLVLLIFVMFCTYCSVDDKSKALQCVENAIAYLEEGNTRKYINLIAKDSPVLGSTKTLLNAMTKSNLKLNISNINTEVINIDKEKAEIKVTMSIKKVKGEMPFADTKTTQLYFLKKTEDKWKIYDTKLLNQESID